MVDPATGLVKQINKQLRQSMVKNDKKALKHYKLPFLVLSKEKPRVAEQASSKMHSNTTTLTSPTCPQTLCNGPRVHRKRPF